MSAVRSPRFILRSGRYVDAVLPRILSESFTRCATRRRLHLTARRWSISSGRGGSLSTLAEDCATLKQAAQCYHPLLPRVFGGLTFHNGHSYFSGCPWVSDRLCAVEGRRSVKAGELAAPRPLFFFPGFQRPNAKQPEPKSRLQIFYLSPELRQNA